MISAQTHCVCREGKPVPTHRVVARGHAFPDHALDQRRASPTAVPVSPIIFTSSLPHLKSRANLSTKRQPLWRGELWLLPIVWAFVRQVRPGTAANNDTTAILNVTLKSKGFSSRSGEAQAIFDTRNLGKVQSEMRETPDIGAETF
jgi:hypothetical protein